MKEKKMFTGRNNQRYGSRTWQIAATLLFEIDFMCEMKYIDISTHNNFSRAHNIFAHYLRYSSQYIL